MHSLAIIIPPTGQAGTTLMYFRPILNKAILGASAFVVGFWWSLKFPLRIDVLEEQDGVALGISLPT